MAPCHCFTPSSNLRSISSSPINLLPPCPPSHSPPHHRLNPYHQRHRHAHSSSRLHRQPIPFTSAPSRSPSQCTAMDRDLGETLMSVASEEESGVEGPVELPAGEDDPLASLTSAASTSPLQSAISILFTGTLAIVLYGSLRKRVKQVKETKFRSSGLESVAEELAKKRDGANALSTEKQAPRKAPKGPPSAFQTFQGGVIAGAIAYVLYIFATTVDAGFASRPVSTVYTIRQLTITIRTIVTGICYLATFVFAANSLGLCLYSIQLALNLNPPVVIPPPAIDADSTSGEIEPAQIEAREEVKEEK